jgi:uncharacterized membrane protein (GlpM family)
LFFRFLGAGKLVAIGVASRNSGLVVPGVVPIFATARWRWAVTMCA